MFHKRTSAKCVERYLVKVKKYIYFLMLMLYYYIKTAYIMEQIKIEGLIFHKNCLKCFHCKKTLKPGNYTSIDGSFYCKPHFIQIFKAGDGRYNFDAKKNKSKRNETAQGASFVAKKDSEETEKAYIYSSDTSVSKSKFAEKFQIETSSNSTEESIVEETDKGIVEETEKEALEETDKSVVEETEKEIGAETEEETVEEMEKETVEEMEKGIVEEAEMEVIEEKEKAPVHTSASDILQSNATEEMEKLTIETTASSGNHNVKKEEMEKSQQSRPSPTRAFSLKIVNKKCAVCDKTVYPMVCSITLTIYSNIKGIFGLV